MGKKKVEIKTIQETRPYVLWRRVSTEQQGESGLGLDAQVTIAKMFMGKDPVEIFTDVFTGTKLRQCKGLWKAIEMCKENNYALVVAKSDRFRSVSEALEVVDAIGERNLIICDLPTSDRFVLTIMFAVWERQAIMGRLNTKIALAERKRQIEEDGGFVSKSGRYCTKLGREKGCDLPEAHRAAGESHHRRAESWKDTSTLYLWTREQLRRGRSQKSILEEAQRLYEENPEQFCTRTGKPLYWPLLSLWAKEILPLI